MTDRRYFMQALAGLGRGLAAPTRGSMLWDWFVKELSEADARRRERLKAVRTPADLAALGERVRRHLLEAIGAFPERSPLNPKVTGVLKRPGYVIEKIVFESRPRFYVTANLYRPERIASPRPAVIQSCGHSPEAKAAADYQRACAGLARKGIVALVFDPLGQGERMMYPGTRGRSASTEHVIAGLPAYLAGRTLTHYRMWDAIRALDYLETRPEVDKTRLGMFGHSGGGMMTLLTAPVEQRLKAVMSCCAVTSFYHKTRALLIADPEQIVPGVYREGIDHPELIAATAPRAFLIGVCLADFVPVEGSRRTYEEVKPISEKVAIVETPGGHLLNQGLREACYGWMLKHLAGEQGDAREPELPVESEADLRATPTGSVMDLPGALGIFDLNRDWARQLAARRKTPADLRRLLGMTARDAGIELTSNLRPGGGTLIVVVAPRRNPALAGELARSGCAVLELDLRGWGETTPDMPSLKAGFAWEEFFALRAIEMGRPLVGMRVLDLLAAVAEASSRHKRIYVVGLNAGAIVALHAAALSDSIAGVALVRGLASYGEIMEQRTPAEPVSSFVPGALAHYDLPDLAARVRPRPCVAIAEPDAQRILEGLRLP